MLTFDFESLIITSTKRFLDVLRFTLVSGTTFEAFIKDKIILDLRKIILNLVKSINFMPNRVSIYISNLIKSIDKNLPNSTKIGNIHSTLIHLTQIPDILTLFDPKQ